MTATHKHKSNTHDRARDLVRDLKTRISVHIDDAGQQWIEEALRREYRLGQMQQRAAARKRAK